MATRITDQVKTLSKHGLTVTIDRRLLVPADNPDDPVMVSDGTVRMAYAQALLEGQLIDWRGVCYLTSEQTEWLLSLQDEIDYFLYT